MRGLDPSCESRCGLYKQTVNLKCNLPETMEAHEGQKKQKTMNKELEMTKTEAHNRLLCFTESRKVRIIRKVTMTALILVALIIWTILGKVVSGALGKWKKGAVQALKKQKISRNKVGNITKPVCSDHQVFIRAPNRQTAPCGPVYMVSTANRSHSHDPDDDTPGETNSR